LSRPSSARFQFAHGGSFEANVIIAADGTVQEIASTDEIDAFADDSAPALDIGVLEK
jgi:hypothetical protein